MIPHFTELAACVLLTALSVSAQTLYRVSQPAPSVTGVVPGSLSVSPLGVGTDGWTTRYIETSAENTAKNGWNAGAIKKQKMALWAKSGPNILGYFPGSWVTPIVLQGLNSDVTKTISTPTTLSFTYEAAASGFRESFSGADILHLETCAFGADGKGTCVEEFVRPSSTLMEATRTGSVVHFYTLAAQPTDTAPTPSPTTSSSSTSSSTRSSSGWGVPWLYACICGTFIAGVIAEGL
ncbi:hypothetical protein C8R43DRAFT_965712 [Mycena crocata]|nr:hypothetical protein C8R43DRAFT_965712 [Mycena crocata]